MTEQALNRGQYEEATNLWGETESIIEEVSLSVSKHTYTYGMCTCAHIDKHSTLYRTLHAFVH